MRAAGPGLSFAGNSIDPLDILGNVIVAPSIVEG
jgi:hypothetical protein